MDDLGAFMILLGLVVIGFIAGAVVFSGRDVARNRDETCAYEYGNSARYVELDGIPACAIPIWENITGDYLPREYMQYPTGYLCSITGEIVREEDIE